MTEGDILELFIRAAAIDHRLPNAPKPAKLKAQSLPFVHSPEEKAGWAPADFKDAGNVITKKDYLGIDHPISEAERRTKKHEANDRLEYGDTGRLAIQSDQFWNGDRITPSQVTEMEYAIELIRAVSRERNRRCLWAYAKSRAKVLFIEQEREMVIVPNDGTHKRQRSPYAVSDTEHKKISFSKWCFEVEDIHRNYGKTCVDHAIEEIASKVFGKTLFTNEEGKFGTLRNRPVLGHLADTLDNSATKERLTVDGWCVRDKDQALRRFDKKLIHIPMSDLRKARRRRDAKRRSQAA